MHKDEVQPHDVWIMLVELWLGLKAVLGIENFVFSILNMQNFGYFVSIFCFEYSGGSCAYYAGY